MTVHCRGDRSWLRTGSSVIMTHVLMPDLVSQRAGLGVHAIATLETLEQSPQALHLHLDQDLDEPRRRDSRLLARYEVRSGCPPPRIRSATSSTVEASPGCPRSAKSTDVPGSASH
jgi:hypothetical protein